MPLNGAFFPLYSYRFNPDICHYTFFMTPAVPKGTKTVITVHDLINELFPQHYNPEDRQADLRSKALRKADGVICVSEHTRNDLLRLYDLDPKKVIVAYNGNSMVNVQPINAELTDPFFLFVGDRRGWRKNFDVVLGCLAGSQELEKYMLVCFGDQEFSAQETTRFAELGLAGRILHRSGSDEVLAGYYKSAAALIYPSRYEGFGLPPVEAMTFGCPVVSSNAPPMSEIIGDAGLFFDPESAGDLHARLRSVIHDEKQVRELMERGYQRVGLFSWEKSCRKIFDFYDQLLNP
jgi:glycosyltransferase involved in cell wall biosynthesis